MKLPYLALGNGKSFMLNTTIVNSGDDAFLPRLHLRFPSNLHFIKVLEVFSFWLSNVQICLRYHRPLSAL